MSTNLALIVLLSTENQELRSELVNVAFGLTPAEVKLMWDTAPPRMPFNR